jgi:DNA invertase Pin-like site-specific DNA recombinase
LEQVSADLRSGLSPGSRPLVLVDAKVVDRKKLNTIRVLLKTAEISAQEIATRFGVSRSTLYRNKLA